MWRNQFILNQTSKMNSHHNGEFCYFQCCDYSYIVQTKIEASQFIQGFVYQQHFSLVNHDDNNSQNRLNSESSLP